MKCGFRRRLHCLSLSNQTTNGLCFKLIMSPSNFNTTMRKCWMVFLFVDKIIDQKNASDRALDVICSGLIGALQQHLKLVGKK